MQTNTINMTIKLFTVLQTLFLLVSWEISVGFCMRSREVNKEKRRKGKRREGQKGDRALQRVFGQRQQLPSFFI